MKRSLEVLCFPASLVMLAACGGAPEDRPADSKKGELVRLVAEGRPLTGQVVSVFPERGTVRVRAEGDAGDTADFVVGSAEMASLRPGQRIRARVVDSEGVPTLTGVWHEEWVSDPNVVAAANSAREENLTAGGMAFREVGEQAPQFALVDQDGRVVTAVELRGQALVIAFIFTRCKVASMCPATTAKMVRLQQAVLAEGIPSTRLIFITLDPAYDTPPVLREYGEQRGVDFTATSMLTGPMEGVAEFLRQFGILVQPGDNVVRHTTGTLLVGPDGRILYREDGSGWTETGFLERLRALHAEGILH